MAWPDIKEFQSDTSNVAPIATLEFSDSIDKMKINLIPALSANQIDERLQLFYAKSLWKWDYYGWLLWNEIKFKDRFWPLNKSIQKDTLDAYKRKAESSLIKIWDYNKKIQNEFWPNAPTVEEIQKEIDRKPSTNTEDFVNKLKELDHPVEVPLIDPLDIMMIWAGVTEMVVALWKKWWSILIEKTWEFFIKSWASKQLIKFKDWWIQMLQKVIEKSWAKEALELLTPKPILTTTTWEKVVLNEATEEWVVWVWKVAGKEVWSETQTVWDVLWRVWEDIDIVEDWFEKLTWSEFQYEIKKAFDHVTEKIEILESWEVNLDKFFETHSKILNLIQNWLEKNPWEKLTLPKLFKDNLNKYMFEISQYWRKHWNKLQEDIRNFSQNIRLNL